MAKIVEETRKNNKDELCTVKTGEHFPTGSAILLCYVNTGKEFDKSDKMLVNKDKDHGHYVSTYKRCSLFGM